MITFTVSILLAFRLEKTITKKKTQSKKAINIRSKNVKPIQIVDATPEIVFDATNLKKAAHIQYELIPNKLKFDLDVICWGPIAKIISTDGILVVKTISDDEISWVPICVDHYLDNLAIADIKTLHEHIIEFKIQDVTSKAGIMVKPDKFVFSAEEIGSSNVFLNISDLNSTGGDESEVSVRNFIKNLIMKCANIPIKDEIVSSLHIPDDYNIFYETIQTISTGQEVVRKDFVLPIIQTTQRRSIKINPEFTNSSKNTTAKQSKMKSTKTTTKSREKATDTTAIQVTVPAEVFFTDPYLSTYGEQNMAGPVKHVFIFLSSSHLLTRAQKLILNPLVIKIKKLRNLPVDSLKRLGIDSIYASYTIPHFAECKSVLKPIQSKVIFNESHVVFTESIPKMKLIEFMQTQKFFVEIHGEIQDISRETPKYSLFGQEPDDKYISRIGSNFQHFDPAEGKYVSPVLLAVASYDISSLIENIWDFREIGQCHEPNATISKKPCSYYNIDTADLLTVCDMNSKTTKPSLLREAELLELGTTLEVEVYLMAPQAATLILHQVPHTYKRLFMILNSMELAQSIYDDIMRHNRDSFEIEVKSEADILTGFVLDNGGNFFFYLEGSSIGFILTIWHLVDDAQSQIGKIFFNTDNAFEQRLYDNFVDRGILTITLKVPLQDILSKTLIYCKKRTPAPCMEALKKICLLLNSSHYKCILQQNLLPTTEELLSLDLEWGVPLRWKVKTDEQA